MKHVDCGGAGAGNVVDKATFEQVMIMMMIMMMMMMMMMLSSSGWTGDSSSP